MNTVEMMPKKGTNNLGRDKLPWSQEIWDHIDRAVHDECQRTKIARRFIPLYGPVSPSALTVPIRTLSGEIFDILVGRG